ncbi:MAG: three-Cys-motif partner protein TcmP [bacterium]|nr:three-Cys-motif partner protein TcmP [bacterium]
MATDEKYVWGAGSPLPPIDPHSKIKHKILRDYLETYIKVLMSNVKIPKLHLSLIDGFSGGGLYQDDGIIQDYKGSPYILLESPFNAEIQLNQGRLKERKIHTNTFLVDIEPDNISHLKSALTLDGYSERFEKDIHFYSEDFCSALPKIVQRIKTIKGGERSLFLLDQYAYKDVPMKAIQHIFSSLDKAEVLLTFNIDTLITYISNKAANRKAIENIGLDTYIPWQQIADIKSTNKEDWKPIIQKFFAEGIRKESGARFMTLFFITPKGSNTWSYWFIHLANTHRANDVMKSLHWKHGNLFSHSLSPGIFQLGYDANQDTTVTGQDFLFLGEEHSFEAQTQAKVEAELSEHIPRIIQSSNSGISLEALMCNIANVTMANTDIVRSSLDLAVKTGDIKVINPKTLTQRTKGSAIAAQDVITPAAQKSFYFPISEKDDKS